MHNAARPGSIRSRWIDGAHPIKQEGLIATQQRLFSHESEIEHLKLLIAKLRRMQFGRKSEKLERQIEQLELKLEELESAKACRASESAVAFVSTASSNPVAPGKPARQPLPEHLPREVRTHSPKKEDARSKGTMFGKTAHPG